MKIFREAFTHCRNDQEIFLGFGIKHKENVLKYYIDPSTNKNNVAIAQPIGEGVNLLLDIIQERRNKTNNSDCHSDNEYNYYTYAEIFPPQKWYDANVIDSKIKCYKLMFEKFSDNTDGGFMGYERHIKIGCYDETGSLLPKTESCFKDYYCLLPIFAILASKFDDAEESNGAFAVTESYHFKPSIKSFVRFCEMFYQSRKEYDFYIEYCDVENKRDLKELMSDFSYYSWVESVVESDKIYENIKVEKFDKSEFLEEHRQFIPSMPKELVMDDQLKPIANAIKNGDCISFLQHGTSGTGKTINCKLICQAICLPIMETINCSENLDEYILGKYIPTHNGIEFVESFVTKAIRHGGAVVFEELNFAKPQYLAFLNSLLDDNGFVRLDNNEVVKRHKNFRFFATMNFGYYGTKQLNQALYNRFQLIENILQVDDKKIKNMLQTRVPSCKKHIEKMLKVYHKLEEKISSEELDFVISPRNLECWAKLAKYIGFEKAAESTVVQIARGDIQMESTVRKLVHSFKWG